uniref:Uncharacterized protein n=1 Tax=Oryctolagus cuniculus TaxID=9986 RepID=A0A5F9DLW6_RABIT
MKQPQIIALMGLNKELSDLLDFSMMFLLPVASGKGWPVSLASAQFRGAVSTCSSFLIVPSHPQYNKNNFFRFIYLKNRVTERQRKREREKFHPLIHS